uniref:Uncharacterized protein n=1 Tax=Branchiostoma floridae TaxID=7739 RepID=C3YQZ5_BRAFL|eukprot:XP_002601225.1 hypothetical protein BRAFLDRAFT_95004 [Branchiostoma floridae]
MTEISSSLNEVTKGSRPVPGVRVNLILLLATTVLILGTGAQLTPPCDIRETDTPFSLKWDLPDIAGSRVTFEVQAGEDARILLTAADDLYRYNNGSYAVRIGILSPFEARGFWISWSPDGTVAVGRYNDSVPFMTWVDPEPLPVLYFGYTTGWVGTARWKFCQPAGLGACATRITNDKTYRWDLPPVTEPRVFFEVQVIKNAVLALSEENSYIDNLYIINIGKDGNSNSVIRKRTNGNFRTVASVTTHGILSEHELRGFWITWSGGTIAVGRGGEISPFMSWVDPEPLPILHVGYSVGYNMDKIARWRFCPPAGIGVLLAKADAGTNVTSTDVWTDECTSCSGDENTQTTFELLSAPDNFRSSLFDSWEDEGFDKVQIVFYEGVEAVAEMQFNPQCTNSTSWFHRDAMTESTWGNYLWGMATNLADMNTNLALVGTSSAPSCLTEFAGWTLGIGGVEGHRMCPWMDTVGLQPQFLYARTTSQAAHFSEASELVHLGCYVDYNERILKYERHISSQQTVVHCGYWCRKNGYSLAGVEGGEECYCGTSTHFVDLNSETPSGGCTMPCSGNSEETCGGGWAIDIYQVSAPLTYESVPDYKWDLSPAGGRGRLRFQVKATQEAHVALSAENWETEDMYHVILGTWNNYESELKSQTKSKSTTTSFILSNQEFREFWISWEGDTIEVGMGSDTQPFLTLNEADGPEIRHFGYRTITGSGEWRFDLPAVQVPLPPCNLVVTNTAHNATLRWELMYSKQQQTGLELYIYPGNYVFLLDANATQFTVDGLSSTTTYTAHVLGAKGIFKGDYVENVFRTDPNPPTNAEIVEVSETSMVLTSSPPEESSVTSYIVMYKERLQNLTGACKVTELQTDCRGLTPGRVYEISMQTVDDSWTERRVSSPVLFTFSTRPLTPTEVHIGTVESTGVTLDVTINDAMVTELHVTFIEHVGSRPESVDTGDCYADSRQFNTETFTVTCPAGCSTIVKSIWGTGVYTENSGICRAAIHDGKITDAGGQVTVYKHPGQDSYLGTQQNGIQSDYWESFGGSFSFTQEWQSWIAVNESMLLHASGGSMESARQALDNNAATYWSPEDLQEGVAFIVIDLQRLWNVSQVMVRSVGNGNNDVTSLTVQVSDIGHPFHWVDMLESNQGQLYNSGPQMFGGFSGVGRYWKIGLQTLLGLPPYLTELGFYGNEGAL